MRLIFILLLLTSAAVQAQPYRVSDKATLKLVAGKEAFQATLTNTHTRPLAVLALSGRWCHHWNVAVRDGSGQDYGLLVPPGPAFMPAPGRFRVLKPGEAMTATFKFSEFVRVNRQTDTMETLKKPVMCNVAYTFEASRDLDIVTRRNLEGSGLGPEWSKLFGQADFLSPIKASLKL